jgi:hypothetical protein
MRLRTLRIGSREFRWTARSGHVVGSGEWHRTVRVRVWGAGKTSRVLQVDLLSKSWPCWMDSAFPASGEVRAIVDYALANGWTPGGRGTHPLTEAEHGERFELPSFLLTDRLVDETAPDPTLRVIRAHEAAGTQRSNGTVSG